MNPKKLAKLQGLSAGLILLARGGLYLRGLNDFLNVLDVQRSLLLSENDLAQSEATMASNLASLYKALGGGWETK